MSKAQILAELPKLDFVARREIFDRICEIEENDLLHAVPDEAEKNLLDREVAEFQKNPQAGSSWEEVEARLRQSQK